MASASGSDSSESLPAIAWALDTIVRALPPGEFGAHQTIYAISSKLYLKNDNGVWMLKAI